MLIPRGSVPNLTQGQTNTRRTNDKSHYDYYNDGDELAMINSTTLQTYFHSRFMDDFADAAGEYICLMDTGLK
jgi:hypothetical protein